MPSCTISRGPASSPPNAWSRSPRRLPATTHCLPMPQHAPCRRPLPLLRIRRTLARSEVPSAAKGILLRFSDK